MPKYHQGLMAMACLLLMAAMAAAQTPSDGLTYQQAKIMDMDKDGRITLAEFLGASSDMSLFESIDADGDAVLDASELRKTVRPPYKTRN